MVSPFYLEIQDCQFHHRNGTIQSFITSLQELELNSQETVSFLTLQLVPNITLIGIVPEEGSSIFEANSSSYEDIFQFLILLVCFILSKFVTQQTFHPIERSLSLPTFLILDVIKEPKSPPDVEKMPDSPYPVENEKDEFFVKELNQLRDHRQLKLEFQPQEKIHTSLSHLSSLDSLICLDNASISLKKYAPTLISSFHSSKTGPRSSEDCQSTPKSSCLLPMWTKKGPMHWDRIYPISSAR
jgi:hypothetical protein